MKAFRLPAVLFALLLIVAACSSPGTSPSSSESEPEGSQAAESQPEETAAAEMPDELVLGLVPSREADVLVENAQPLADYLTEQLGIPVESFVPNDYTGLIAAMEAGQADIGAFGPFSLLQAQDEAGAEIILQSARDGSVTYHTQWMTNNPDKYCEDEPEANEDGLLFCNGTLEAEVGPVGEDAIASIEPGTPISFVEQASASGYIFPAVQLLNAGIDPVTGIEPIFSGGHDNSVIAVCNGDAEVGVSFNDARTILEEGDCENMDNVVVFALSNEIPNDGVAVRSELPDDLKQQIADALIAYAETDEGKEVLDSVYEIDEFAPADLDAFEIVRQAADELGITSD
ncbi:MAG: phosphate/phosphite/phosphonate ABC transporter substrate-binding protein [Chloroflexota bacterium]